MTTERDNNYASFGDGLSEEEVFTRSASVPRADDLFAVPFASPQDEDGPVPPDILPATLLPKLRGRLDATQTLLLAGIVVVVVILGSVILRVPRSASSMADAPIHPNGTPETVPTPSVVVTDVDANAEPPQPVVAVAPPPPPSPLPNPVETDGLPVDEWTDAHGPLSLRVAEDLYSTKEFELAYAAYRHLLARLNGRMNDIALKEFLGLRMALCAKGLGEAEEMNRLFAKAVQSRSSFIRSLARYHQSLAAFRSEQYANALSWAYQALALSDGAVKIPQWRSDFALNCRFLICRAATKQALALRAGESLEPASLWYFDPVPDPFIGLSADEIREMLEAGQYVYEKAFMGPRVVRHTNEASGLIWDVISNGAPMEELFIHFASNAGMDVNWAFDAEAGLERIEPSLRRRPLHVYLKDRPARDVAEIVSGCAGLFSDLNAHGTINLINPDPVRAASLSALSQIWTEQAVVLWQRLTWASQDKTYIANAHFALGLLHEIKNRPADAINEYRLLADRFDKHALAPESLLRSSRLKARLHDYLGAREDLKLLVDQYPDATFSGSAYLDLADASLNARLYQEAFRLYNKVFNMDLSQSSRTVSALGAGTSRFQQGHFEDAARWFIRYLDMALQDPEANPASARLLLGRTLRVLTRHDKACEVFRRVMVAESGTELYYEALTAYVGTRLEQDMPVDAMNLLESKHPVILDRTQANEITFLRARTYRAMGLPAKANALLERHLPQVVDRDQRTRWYLLRGHAAIEREDYPAARSYFAQTLEMADPGGRALEAGYWLAYTSLRLDETDRVIQLSRQVLSGNPSSELEEKTYALLIEAYRRRRDDDRALELLMQRLPDTTAAEASAPLVSKNG